MSLGTSTRDPVGRPEALETTMPGAFPEEDVPGAASQAPAGAGLDLSSKNDRNKLRKPNDPRGWDSESLAKAQGHRHTDSGVGLPEPDVASKTRDADRGTGSGRDFPADSTRQSQPAGQNSRSEGLVGAARREHAGLPADFNNKSAAGSRAAEDRSTAVGAASLPGDGRSSGFENEGTTGASQDPYWGDLPRGAGVYNTVIGHGSQEEQQARRASQEQGAGTARSAGLVGVASTSDQQRAFSLAPEQTTREQAPRSSQHPADSQYAPNIQRREQVPPSAQHPADSRLAQLNDPAQSTHHGAAGKDASHRGGVDDATRAATIAFADDRDKKQQPKEWEAGQPKEEKESKLHALFYRGHDDKADKAPKKHEAPEDHHHKKQQEAAFAPVAADRVGDRTRDDQPRLPGQRSHNATTDPTPKYPSDIEAYHSRGGPAVASAAAGGAAAYGASKYVDRGEHKHGQTPASTYGRSTATNPNQGFASQATEDTKTKPGSGPGSAYDEPAATGATQGYSGQGYPTQQGRNSAVGHGSTADHNGLPVSVAAGGAAAYGASRFVEGEERTPAGGLGTIRESTGHSKAKETAAADAVGAGAAGAYGASRAHRGARDDSQYETLQSGTSSGVGPDERGLTDATSPRTTTTERQIPRQSNRATGVAAAGVGSAAAGGATAAHASRSPPSKEGAIQAPTHGHSKTDGAHNTSHDQYNHLSSGTPSGINLDRD